jgi:hypothetical protein
MSVFLRWGVFGILGVAALLYAYNANKRLAERHDPQTTQLEGEDAGQEEYAEDATPEEASADEESDGEMALDSGEVAADAPEMPEACEGERRVAERALKMRRDGAQLDQLLRIDLIALQDDQQRRERLASVATHWFEREGRDPDAAALRAEVLDDCRDALKASRAP